MTTANIVDQIAQFIERFVFIKDKSVYRLLALWVIQTHIYKDFEYVGYIFAHSPEPESGKSRLLEVLDLLVANSSGILIKPTDAILFRTANGVTQILDEVDTWTNGDFLRGVLNAGFRRGGVVKRNERTADGKKWEPVDFLVYAPRIMAGIGTGILPATTKDRTFILAMSKQTREERREKFRARRVKADVDALRSSIASWVSANCSEVVARYDDAERAFPYLAHLRDRTMDIAEPLAAILETSYKGAELNERRIEFLEALSVTRKDGNDVLADHRTLRELLRLTDNEDPLIGNASELAAKCALNPQPTEREMSETLRRYGFESRSIRVGESVRYRYELTRTEIADICNRFGCVSAESQAASGPNSEPMLLLPEVTANSNAM